MARDNERLERRRRENWNDRATIAIERNRDPHWETFGIPIGDPYWETFGLDPVKKGGRTPRDKKLEKGSQVKLIQRLVIAQRFVCALCDKPFGYDNALRPSIDHKVPRSRGGTNAIENLQAAHRICNELKGDAIL